METVVNIRKEDCLTKREAARRLDVTPMTVFNMRKRGDLRFFRFNGDRRVYIPKTDIEKLLTPIPGDNYPDTRASQYSEREPEKAN